ncbi:MAG: hypothetical protein F4139_15765 [Gemmatimonadetes bacterium]|nr:hypothetical protein [Gemmatimonadota bacterium]MYA63204.1 hypothetical protein [Gemmatimonadota bacterium]MYB99288.1 hypothetical protein [Gemmatimonadota bacterium]MYH54371.1 hypothetical protein [Gemmatimonadota bacterium]MYI45889.1 hypothetical protein [Gemmatimonadota bacterium]
MISRSLTTVLVTLATPVGLMAQEAGRGAMRPYVHVLLAYAVVWLLILLWVWMIARQLKRVGDRATPDGG